MRSGKSKEDKLDYMIECMLSEYANYDKLLTSHNISIFRKFVYQVMKIDRRDFIGREVIHEEILRLGNMLEEDEMVGECNTYDLVGYLSDELLQTIEECVGKPRGLKKKR